MNYLFYYEIKILQFSLIYMKTSAIYYFRMCFVYNERQCNSNMPKIGGRQTDCVFYFLCEIFLTANAYIAAFVCEFNDVELEMTVW